MKRFFSILGVGLLLVLPVIWIYRRWKSGKRLCPASVGVIGGADGPTVIITK